MSIIEAINEKLNKQNRLIQKLVKKEKQNSGIQEKVRQS